MGSFRVAALTLMISTTTAFAFQSTARIPSPSLSLQHEQSRRSMSRHYSTLHQTAQDIEQDEEEYEVVEFFVSPEQITSMRKEANKRDANKQLPKYFLSSEESMDVSPETIGEILTLFESDELIEVRGVAKGQKKQAFDTCYKLAATLEDTIEKPVVVVDTKGFSVKLYCPWVDDEGSNGKFGKIQLRTSYKPGQWSRKAKALRDARGQVVIGEDGKSIKEIPE